MPRPLRIRTQYLRKARQKNASEARARAVAVQRNIKTMHRQPHLGAKIPAARGPRRWNTRGPPKNRERDDIRKRALNAEPKNKHSAMSRNHLSQKSTKFNISNRLALGAPIGKG